MRTPKQYQTPDKRIMYPETRQCLTCHQRLKRYATLSQRTVITLEGPVQVVHLGTRCPNPACPHHHRVYRSVQADALALPGFTFGLDIVVLVGYLKLHQHHTLDEVHQAIAEKLQRYDLTLSRRNIMYLCEAYCALLQAAHHARDDPAYQRWVEQVREHGGLIISIDGIQPDKGNETIYLVRDVLTGRVLNAQNVTISDTDTIKQVLHPVLDLPVLGVISDAQSSLRDAIAALWPEVPHQTCQFHYLQEAARPMFEADRAMRAKMRKTLGDKLRPVRPQLDQRLRTLHQHDDAANSVEVHQLRILRDYTLAIQASLHVEGKLPFTFPGLIGYAALDALAEGLAQCAKRGQKQSNHSPARSSRNWRDCKRSSPCARRGKSRPRRSLGCVPGFWKPSVSWRATGRTLPTR
jgi:hypothetical protein